MKVHGESGSVALPFLALALDEGEWSASYPGRFTTGNTTLSAHWIAGLVVLIAGLEAMENPLPGFEPRSSSP
jgi:hypothetical protein